MSAAIGRIQVTKNYRLFRISEENRPLDLKKHQKLSESMKLYGFLKCFPLVVRRDKDGNLVLMDGQHRLKIAESLGLPVYWIEEQVEFDIAVINNAAKTWSLRDYALKFIANGHKCYQEGLDFSERYSLPLGTAFALLAGTNGFCNCQGDFVEGKFKIKDRPWAEAVAGIYGPVVKMAPRLRNARFIEACMGVCRVEWFDSRRFIGGCNRCQEKLIPYSTKEAYLDMIEELYNFGRRDVKGLKAAATMAMRERNPASKKNGKKAEVVA